MRLEIKWDEYAYVVSGSQLLVDDIDISTVASITVDDFDCSSENGLEVTKACMLFSSGACITFTGLFEDLPQLIAYDLLLRQNKIAVLEAVQDTLSEVLALGL